MVLGLRFCGFGLGFWVKALGFCLGLAGKPARHKPYGVCLGFQV